VSPEGYTTARNKVLRWTLVVFAGASALLGASGFLFVSTPAQDEAATYKVGMAFRRSTPTEPYNWRGGQTHALTAVVWYPAEPSTTEKPVEIPGLNFFELGRAVQNANVTPAPAKFPLIVISHGTGGSALSMAWLGEALAARGYLVAAVNHPGTNATEPYTVEGFSTWWQRARDLTEVIDGMLADSDFAGRIDSTRIAAAGFSLGGYTMIEIAGGITDVNTFLRHCDQVRRYLRQSSRVPNPRRRFSQMDSGAP
jgi:predicted dienelactone hydrolase